MCPQNACITGCKVTLVAFVGLFSAMRFQMCPQMACLRGSIITLVAFVWVPHLFNFNWILLFKILIHNYLVRSVVSSVYFVLNWERSRWHIKEGKKMKVFEKYPLRFVFNNIDFSHFNPMIVFLNFPIVTVTTQRCHYITIGLCSMEKKVWMRKFHILTFRGAFVNHSLMYLWNTSWFICWPHIDNQGWICWPHPCVYGLLNKVWMALRTKALNSPQC